jgi:hypothetical protein
VNVSAASVVKLPLHAPNWENGVRVCLLRKYMSLSAMLFLGLYLCILIVRLDSRLLVLIFPGFGNAIAMVIHHISGWYPILTHPSIREWMSGWLVIHAHLRIL